MAEIVGDIYRTLQSHTNSLSKISKNKSDIRNKNLQVKTRQVRSKLISNAYPYIILAFLTLSFFLMTDIARADECVIEKNKWKCIDNPLLDHCEKKEDCIEWANVEIYRQSQRPQLQVHGTEYVSGELAKAWLQLIDSDNMYVNNATCYLDIYYPDGTYFVQDTLMNFLDNGVYYYDVVAPYFLGVYPMIAECFYITETQEETVDARAIKWGTGETNDYTYTQFLDSSYWSIEETNVGGSQYRLSYNVSFNSITPPSDMESVSVIWSGKWNSISLDTVSVNIYNFTSGRWIDMPNTIYNSGGVTITVSNSILTNNVTKSGLVSPTGQAKVKFNDTTEIDSVKSTIQNDYISLNFIYVSNQTVEEVKGSAEMHISGEETVFYTIDTLCEGEYYQDSSCAVITNDDEFDIIEGEIEDNVTVYSFLDVSSFWHYDTQIGVTCGALYWIKEYNETSGNWDLVPEEDIHFHTNPDDSCKIGIRKDFENDGIYYYWIKMDNYPKYKQLQHYLITQSIKETTQEFCYDLADESNYTLSFPIVDSTNISNDTVLSSCHYGLDVIWWSELFYNISQNATTIGEFIPYYLESDWSHDKAQDWFQVFSYYYLNETTTLDYVTDLGTYQLAYEINATDKLNYTYFDEQFGNISFGDPFNYTLLDDRFNQSEIYQQQIFTEIQNNNQSNYIWFETTWSNQNDLLALINAVNSTVNSRFDTVDSNLLILISNASTIISDIATLSSDVSSIASDITSLIADVSSLDSLVQSFYDDFNSYIGEAVMHSLT